MSIAEMFSDFVGNLAISNAETISTRYGELTSALNNRFRDTESKTANTVQVGSFGRKTGINGISDLDMLYIMPKSKWDDYKAGKQLHLLQDAKDAILKRYPTTKVKVDRLVVTVTYTNFHVEVQPVFEQDDQGYLYPDTKNGGSWKTTKPREEMTAVADMDAQKNANLRPLCKMARAWKNKHGVGMGGLLLDTLAYNFLESTSDFDTKSFLYYDWMSRDFFKYLSELPEQGEYAAPGSRQRVRVKKKFKSKAKKAHKLCLEAIEAENQKNVNDKWKKVYGRPFPAAKAVAEAAVAKSFAQSWDNTEEFIEDKFPVDIRESMRLDCEVKQNGFRELFLLDMLAKMIPLMTSMSLRFEVKEISAAKPYDIYWKVLNRGNTARKKNCIRGQITKDEGAMQKTETTNFRGDHIVECYCVKDGVVVAKDRIHVPIVAGQSEDD
ncbi:nucleotidyltransferase [Acidithiobacillus ferriphilus]|uniref:nucleotide-binding domain-containing protein n=1 Tax=Acidithiobacillus ferriphilus TaxID=1689834 RepID=UPI001C07DA1C|nr:nucleotidyltransferase [Acidithiobacillus ferriphilus]MBU2846989.1 nucleotidyltransferase [Acidithiobacillus ferriphilus]